MYFANAEESICEVRGERGASIMCWSPTASERLMKRVGEINLSYLWCLKEKKTKCSGMAEGKRVFDSSVIQPVSDLPQKRRKVKCFWNEPFVMSHMVILHTPWWLQSHCEANCCCKMQPSICSISFNRVSLLQAENIVISTEYYFKNHFEVACVCIFC